MRENLETLFENYLIVIGIYYYVKVLGIYY